MKPPFFHSILSILVFQFMNATGLLGGTYLGYSDYQIITDTKFPAGQYFKEMADSGVNFQRIWAIGYSGVEPSFTELLPFVKIRGKYNLQEIEPRYIERLQSVLKKAGEHNQRVMLTFFDNWSLSEDIFPKTPWHFKNNLQRLRIRGRADFYSVQNHSLLPIQENYVRTIVAATKSLTPIYEIVNEGGGVDCAQISEWHERVASWIQDEFPEAEIAVNLIGDCPEVLNAPWVSVISLHHNIWRKKSVCKYVTQYPNKEIIMDTDGAYKYRNDNRLVKQWLKEAQNCGASFNHKDDIYNPDRELLEIYSRAGSAGVSRD